MTIPQKNSQEWSSTMISGGKPVCFPWSSGSGVYSADGKYFIVVLTHQIRVYFVSTRQCVRSVDVEINAVDAKLDPQDPNHVIVFTSTGEYHIINWKEKLPQPVVSVGNVNNELLSVIRVTNRHFFHVVGSTDKLSPLKIAAYDRKNDTSIQIFEIPNVLKFASSLNNERFAFLTTAHQVVVIDLSYYYEHEDRITEKHEYQIPQETLPFVYKSPIVSIAVSNNSVVALGSASGPIQILFGGLIDSSTPQKLLKWHIGPVKSLLFTADNNYLISGGLEKVVVFWQIDTDKTQFLPRLNGSIEKISIDPHRPDYYQMMLKVSSNEADSNFELLVVSGVDLVSRLSVNSVRPNFVNTIDSTLAKIQKKFSKLQDKFDKTKLKYDYTSSFEINPKSGLLYFPSQSLIQAWDLARNEQSFLQNIAPVVSTGKVKSEAKLVDPYITQLKFSQDGEWMCTFDIDETSEVDGLLSKNDKKYALKFWKYIEPTNRDNNNNSIKNSEGYWELTTKVIDPHGNSQPVLSITPAPASVNQGLGFLTADAKGNLRVWKPRIPKEIYSKVKTPINGKLQQTAWSVTRTKNLELAETKSIDTAWSDDGSVIVLAHGNNIKLFNGNSLSLLENDRLNISDSNIRSLDLIGTDLIVLSKTRITSFNLLTSESNELAAKVNSPPGARSLISVDPSRNTICLGVNYYSVEDRNIKLKSKVVIFEATSSTPIAVINHPDAISSIKRFNNGFLFVDVNARVGQINRKDDEYVKEARDTDISTDIEKMLNDAHATSNLINNRTIEDSSEEDVSKVISLNNFQTLFENSETTTLDTLFDSIVKIIM